MKNLGKNIYVEPQFQERPILPGILINEEMQNNALSVLRDLESLKKEYQKREEEYAQQMLELKNKLEETQNLTQLLTNKDETNQREIASLTNIQQSLQDEITTLTETMNLIKVKVATTESELIIRQKKLEESEKNLQSLTSSNQQYARDLEEILKNQSIKEKKTISKYMEEIKLLQKKNQDLAFNLSNVEKNQEITIKTKIFENESKIKDEMSKLRIELATVRGQYESEKNLLKNAHDEILSKETSIKSLIHDNKKQLNEIRDYYSEKSKLEQELYSLKMALDVATQQLQTNLLSRSIVNDSSGDSQMLQTAIERIAKEKDLMIKNINDQNKLNSETQQDEIRKLNKIISEQKENILELEQKKAAIETKLYSKDTEYKEKMTSIDSFKLKITELQKKIDDQSLLIKKKDKELGEKTILINEQISKIAALNFEINNLKKEREDMKKSSSNTTTIEVEQLERKLKLKEIELNTLQNEYTFKINEMSKEKINSFTELENKQKKINELQEEKDDLEIKISMQNDVLNTKANEILTLKEEISNYVGKIQELSSNVKIQTEEKKKISLQFESLVQQITTITQQYESQSQAFKNENEFLKTRIKNCEMLIGSYDYKNSELEAINTQLIETNKNIQIVTSDLHEKINQSNMNELNDQNIANELQNLYDIYSVDYDNFFNASNEQITNLTLYTKKYTDPLLNYLEAFFTVQKIHLTFARQAQDSIKKGVQKLIDKNYEDLTKSNIRISDFKSAMKKEDLTIALNSYYQTMAIVNSYYKKLDSMPNISNLYSYYNIVYASLQNLLEKAKMSQAKVKSPAHSTSINLIIGLCNKNDSSLGIIKQTFDNITQMMGQFEKFVIQLVYKLNDLKKGNEEIISVHVDLANTLNFIQPSFNSVGQCGNELLMFVKNLKTEIKDQSYGKNRNSLVIKQDILKQAITHLGTNFKSPVQNDLTCLSHLYNLRKFFAKIFCIKKLQTLNDGETYELPNIKNQIQVLDSCFANVEPSNFYHSGYTINIDNTFYKVNEQNNIHVSNLIVNNDITREALFLWMSSVLLRSIIKLENYSKSNIFVNNYKNTRFDNMMNDIYSYVNNTDLTLTANNQTGDIYNFLNFQKLIFYVFSNLACMKSESLIKNELKSRQIGIKYLLESEKRNNEILGTNINPIVQTPEAFIIDTYKDQNLQNKLKRIQNFPKLTFSNLTSCILGIRNINYDSQKVDLKKIRETVVDYLIKGSQRFYDSSTIPHNNKTFFFTEGTIGEKEIKEDQFEMNTGENKIIANLIDQNKLEKSLLIGVKKNELANLENKIEDFNELPPEMLTIDDISTVEELPEDYLEKINMIDDIGSEQMASNFRNHTVTTLLETPEEFKNVQKTDGHFSLNMPKLDLLDVAKPKSYRSIKNFNALGQNNFRAEFEPIFTNYMTAQSV